VTARLDNLKRLTRSGHHKTMSISPSPRLSAGVVLIAVLLGLVACRRSPEVAATPKPPVVTVVAATQLRVPVYGQYIGQTEAVKTVEVRARVEGFIERQVASDGADVKVGDLLFVIDPRPFEVALRQAQANVARDIAQLRQTEAALVQREAEVRQAQANLDRDLAQFDNARTQEGRYRTLLQRELISSEQYDQLRTNMTALEATVQADRAALENAKAALTAGRATIENARAVIRADEAAVDSAQIQLGYTTIRSPLEGRMGRAEVNVGSLVGRLESTLLATVSTLDPMYVNFSVSEREALSVWRRRAEMLARPGPAGITITLPDDSAYPHGGRLDFVDRAVDPRTGTLALRATFPNPARLLRPGQYTRLRVLLEDREALVVPQAAIQESQGAASLFVVGADQTVQARTVRMGPRFGPLWVVEEGVKPGERVVVKGLQQVRAGMLVEPTLEALPPATGS
jgi:RND family efflux transporter MFP subunit